MNPSSSFSSTAALLVCNPGDPEPIGQVDVASPRPLSSIPPSFGPDSAPLGWIPESRALEGVPESRMLTRPPPPIADLEFGDPAWSALGRPARWASPALPAGLLDSLPPPDSSRISSVPESGPVFVGEHPAAIGALRLTFDRRQRRAAPADAVREIALQVLELVFARRRLLNPASCEPSCEECLAPHLARTEAMIRAGKPIHFVLPAFPAKSPNPKKVLGTLPDMAEVVALTFLQNLCTRIRGFYAPGARLTICSDGRVFSDLVQVSDDDVSAYGRELGVIVEQLRADSLDFFTLEDQFGAVDCDGMRRELVEQHARPLEELSLRIAGGGPALRMFNGIARFLFEDMVAMEPEKSRTLVRKITKARAYQVIQRSDAWSMLVEQTFPEALRLSIHPQPAHSAKIGIHLMETLDNWLTPWHATAVKVGTRYVLMKRYHAERLGASLVRGGVRPSHFVAQSIDLERLRSAEEDEESGVQSSRRRTG